MQDKLVTLILSAGRHGISCALQTPSVLNYFEHHVIQKHTNAPLLRFIILNLCNSIAQVVRVFVQAIEKSVQESIAMEVMEAGMVMEEAWA